VVLQAALQKIREYPLGLLIGFYKSYRDFFTIIHWVCSICFPAGNAGWGWFFWSLCIAGLIYALRVRLPGSRKA
jgi:hypothetical protein